jgi:S-adenosylmethionine/arginine decarboxylase-like enzyme
MRRPLHAAEPPSSRPWHQQLCTLQSGTGALAKLPVEQLRAVLEEACAITGLELTQVVEHRFEPQGASLVLLGPALRLALHTWPERDVATLDVLGPEAELLGLVVQEVAALLGCEAQELRALVRRGDEESREDQALRRSTGS